MMMKKICIGFEIIKSQTRGREKIMISLRKPKGLATPQCNNQHFIKFCTQFILENQE
jgi:hypothetical protein